MRAHAGMGVGDRARIVECGLRVKMCVWLGVSRGLDLGLRVKMCVWLGVSRGLDLAFLNAD